MGNTFYFSFEPALMQWLQGLLGDGGSKLFSNISALGEETMLILILGFMYWCLDKQFGIYIGENMVIGLTLNPLIKNVFLRRRPYMDNPGVKCIRPVEPKADIYDISVQGYSFPSGHSMNSMIAYGSIGNFVRKKAITIVAFIIPILVGISRLTAGVHYPTDVLVGWLVGLAVVFLIPFILQKAGKENRWKVNLIIFLLTALGIIYCRTEDYFSGLGVMAGFYLGIEFEDRFVQFEGTLKPVRCVLRIAGGLLIYLVLNKLLKMPFSSDFLSSATMAAYMIRTVRYFIVLFVMIGVYPFVFKLFDKAKN